MRGRGNGGGGETLALLSRARYFSVVIALPAELLLRGEKEKKASLPQNRKRPLRATNFVSSARGKLVATYPVSPRAALSGQRC